MIPFVSLTTFTLGPVTLYAWGLFVALGFLLGAFMAARFAKRRGGDPQIIWDVMMLLMISGMIGGRLGHVLLYDPEYYVQHPLEVIEIWKGGLSFYGGVIASVIAGWWYLRRRQVDVFKYADYVAFGLPFGKWIGRIGCFLIHDHPGTATDFVLGVQYPDGVTRHDLGLYLSINAFALSVVMLWLSRKDRPTGTYVATFAVWYGVTRFFLDFLRVVDARYFGFTPGQYFSLLLFVFGIGIVVWIKKRSKNC
jgi:phosphatidylglycerol---prolipoprotein diacylglyceryl transferase